MSQQDSGRAIGAVSRLLRDHLVRRGFDVTVGRPEDAEGTDSAAKLNLFLYETSFDGQLRNQPLRDGERPPLWLVLKYLLTAFDARELSDSTDAHELLGRGLQALQRLAVLPLDAAVAADVRLALEHNPEPLKLSFDEAGVDLLSKVMQGSEDHYRLSAAFQVRPVLIVPGLLPTSTLLVGIDYTTAPETVIGRDGVQIATIPSLGARLHRLEPERFEAGGTFVVWGDDIAGADMEVVLGNTVVTTLDRTADHLVVRAEGPGGTPIASGTTLSAGELPLVVRRRLSPTRTRASNLLAARLLPTLAGATFQSDDLVLQGTLLGAADDDVIVLLARAAEGTTARLFDTFVHAADQRTLRVAGARTGLPAGNYRVLLRVNDQPAHAGPVVTA